MRREGTLIGTQSASVEAELGSGSSGPHRQRGASANRLEISRRPARPPQRSEGGVSAETRGGVESAHARHTALTTATATGHGISTHRAVALATDRSAHHKSLPVNGRVVVVRPACQSREGPAGETLSAASLPSNIVSGLRTSTICHLDDPQAWVVSCMKATDELGSFMWSGECDNGSCESRLLHAVA
jgi:hypothetical protein